MFCHVPGPECHVSSWSAGAPVRSPPVRILPCRSSIAFRSAPFSPPPAGPASGTLFRAYHARGRAFAPARFARLIARAHARQTRGAPLPPVPPGSFRADARRSGLRTPLPRALYLGLVPGCQDHIRNNPEFFRIQIHPTPPARSPRPAGVSARGRAPPSAARLFLARSAKLRMMLSKRSRSALVTGLVVEVTGQSS